MEKKAKLLSGLTWLVLLCFTVPTVVLMAVNWKVEIPGNWGPRGFQIAYAIVFMAFATLIINQQPGNVVGWFMAGGAIFSTIQAFIIEYAAHTLLVGAAASGGLFAAWMVNFMWVPIVGLLSTYTFLYFPNGRLLSPRWRPVSLLSGVVQLVFIVVLSLTPGPIANFNAITNPLGLTQFIDLFVVLNALAGLLFVASIFASGLSLVLRYRRASHETRQQLKWLAGAAILVAICFPFSMVFQSERLFQVILILSLLGIPMAIGFAMLKYRLYDIDIIINRTLVYGLLSALLALFYFGGVTLVQNLLRAVTGQESPLAVVIITLTIAALFNPLRQRMQVFIDRRFYRQKYDAQLTLEQFSEELRNEVDLEEINTTLLEAVGSSIQPQTVSLWLASSSEKRQSELS